MLAALHHQWSCAYLQGIDELHILCKHQLLLKKRVHQGKHVWDRLLIQLWRMGMEPVYHLTIAVLQLHSVVPTIIDLHCNILLCGLLRQDILENSESGQVVCSEL